MSADSNTTGHKNVYWKKSISKWQVSVGFQGKQHHMGYFRELEDAIRAAHSARLRFHGQFANHG